MMKAMQRLASSVLSHGPVVSQALSHQQVRCLSLLRDRAYIAGDWTAADGGGTFEVFNPATGAVVGSVPDCRTADVERAVAAAAAAQQAWGETAARERSRLLHSYHSLIHKYSEDLAALVTAESGKPLAEARGEVAYGNDYIQWFAGEARRVYGEVVDTVPNRETIVIRQPAGPAALITPWNFPVAMLLRKLGAALACGCTSVSKPAEDTPLSALALAAIAEEAGIPAGVFSVLTSSRESTPEVGFALCADPRVAVVSFTGSTAVGKLLYRQCAATVKKVGLELGGNAPCIVFDGADVDKAVAGCMMSKFRNAGQTCISTNRILVQSGVYDRFVEALSLAMTSQLKPGDGTQPGVNFGPLINDRQRDRVASLVDSSVKGGARAQLGGGKHELGGLFFPPTLLTGVTPHMPVFQEEIFGPVAACARFETEQEAVQIANNTDMGLAAYVFTENLSQAWRVCRRLQYGMVGINEGAISSPDAPFGGWKQSGLGREGSRHALEEYTQIKYICVNTK